MGLDTSPRDEFYGCRLKLPSGWPALVFVILWGIGFGSAVFMAKGIGLLFGAIGALAVVGGVSGLIKPLRGQLRGYRLDDAGLTEVRLGQPPRCWPWASMREVKLGDQGACLVTDSGEVRWSTEVSGWRRLAQKIQAGLNPDETAEPEGDLLSPDEVRGWLGLAAGQVLRVGAASSERRTGLLLLPVWVAVTLALAAFYSAFFIGFAKTPGLAKLGSLLFITAHASIFFGVFSGGLGLKVYRSLRGGRVIVADGEGLSLRHGLGWQHYGWDDLQAMTLRDGAWRLEVGEETVTIEPTWRGAAALIRTVQSVLEARRRGLRLPSGGGVSAAAISLARETGASSAELERGLSLSERED